MWFVFVELKRKVPMSGIGNRIYLVSGGIVLKLVEKNLKGYLVLVISNGRFLI